MAVVGNLFTHYRYRLAKVSISDVEPVLANAFHVAGIDYRWERGRVVPASS